tara:strand:- start:489 stop:932 length:444 start_codon:yes stop_codon:yes gene_type:complete
MKDILLKTLKNAYGLYPLKKATKNSAGFDIIAAIEKDIIIGPSQSFLIPSGFSLEMPEDIEAQVRPRSGLALKNLITVLNSPGTIDSDYRGEISVILINHSKENFVVKRGMRIAQIVFIQLPVIKIKEVDSINQTERGTGGFGSTGV